MRIVFMGSPDFSVFALHALLESGHRVVGVFSQAPKAAGRGQEESKTAVHKAAEEKGIPVFTPKRFSESGVIDTLHMLHPDVIIVVAYGLLLPKTVLTSARLGCINIHASLLPRWRGAAPVQRALLAGDSETGITIMRMNEGLDTGDILLKEALPIRDLDTAGSLHDALSMLGGKLIVQTLDKLKEGTLEATPQTEEGATYAAKINKSDAAISFDLEAQQVARHIRAFTPWPGAYAFFNGERVKWLNATWSNEPTDKEPGTILDNYGWVACAKGRIRPLSLQRSGKTAQDYEAFTRGFPLAPGAEWENNATA